VTTFKSVAQQIAEFQATPLAEKKPRTKPKRIEDKIHVSIAKALKAILPTSVVWWSNESRGVGFKEGSRRKARGVKAGVPDMEFHFRGVRSPHLTAVFIELKRPGGETSNEQDEMLARLREAGAVVHVCHSLDEVLEALEGAGCPMMTRL
jgi:hypothetical protein